MQSSSSSSTLTREEQEKLLTPHEYIGDASMGYKDCILCRHRTEFTCVKCGYCYSCHWKKEQMEEIESRDNLKDFLLSLSRDRDEENQELKSQKQEENKSTTRSESEKWGTLDVLGQPAEPICTYYRCHHKFSLHGSRRCRCKHPTNKALGIFVRHH
ncbi:MAG TPA: hypothetical protein VFS97_00495 [Nitrososphaeraceae archaeon]|nr:hypothetical protein [Nitrososphaeraceae archaeon]